jgi:hypothetical protein
MASVFVSYAREDAAKAQVIAQMLEAESFDVWIDQRLGSGSEFSREIEEALKRAAAVVVLWSINSVESPWVRDEAAEGRDSGRLVPVLLDECRPPIGFRQFQTTDLSHWSGRGKPRKLHEVVAAVRVKAGAPARSSSSTPSARTTRLPRSPIAWTAAALVLVVIAAGALLLGNRLSHKPAASTLSVGLLPFAAEASDVDARRLAGATRDAVAHTLSYGAFAIRTIDSTTPGHLPPSDFLISGQVTSAADKFVATVRMEETAHHVIVFSRQFEASRDTISDFPELVGAQVAAQLSWTAPLIAMERRHPTNPAIITALLQSSVTGLDSIGTLHDYETSRRLASEAPHSPLAQNNFAFNTAFAFGQLPPANRGEAVAAARQAADRTIQLAPEYGGAYIPWCLLHSEQRMVECETYLRKGMRADRDDTFGSWFLSRLLNNVGRNDEAAQLARLSLAHDPYMPYKIGHMLRTLEVTGQGVEAADLYRQSRRWWPKQQILYWNRFIGILERGDFEALDRFHREAARDAGVQEPVPLLGSAVKAKSASAVRGACANQPPDNQPLCMLAFATVGDLDAAFHLADQLYPSRRGRTPSDEERIWLDNPNPMPLGIITAAAAAPLRRDPRYVPLAARVGLVEYWRSGRPPDFCRAPKPEPICRSLLKR